LATAVNAPQAKNFKINGDRLWTDIFETAKWSAPSNGGLSRLCATEHDKKMRDWFRDQVVAMGADYKVRLATKHRIEGYVLKKRYFRRV